MKKLYIFDLDGTLLDTIEDIANSMNAALAALGFPGYGAEWYKRKVGAGAAFLARDALPPGNGDKINEIVRLYQTGYRNVKTRPYDGIPELLAGLSAAGAALAVLSNKPHGITCEVIGRYFGDISFAAVFGGREGKPLKPDPSAADEILEAAGVSASETAYIGDSEVDMAFAVNAGMFGIGVLWGFRSERILTDSGADAIVSTPREIIGVI